MNTTWFFLVPLIFLFAYLGQNGRRYSIFFRAILSLLLAYIVGFGGIASQDHDGYARMYNEYYVGFSDVGDYVWFSLFRDGYAVESGYILLNIFSHMIGLGEAGFFFVIALFVNGTTIHHIFKQKQPLLSLLVLLFISAFMSQQANLVRQFLALGVMMYFIDYLAERKNWWKYLLGVVLAAQFHASALFFLIFMSVYWVNTIKSKEILRYTLIGLISISILIGAGLISFNILGLFDFVSAYEGRFVRTNDVGSDMSIFTASRVTIPALFILFNKRLFNRSSIFIVFISMAAIFANVGFEYPNLRRMYWYFDPLAYIYLVQYLNLNMYAVDSNRSIVSGVKYTVIAFGVYMMLKNYIFNPNQLLMSTTYQFNQFFS